MDDLEGLNFNIQIDTHSNTQNQTKTEGWKDEESAPINNGNI